jgi:hypothetical protein
MKSNEVGTTLKHPETINGNVKNLSKRMKMKDKGECHFYFKNPLGLSFGASKGGGGGEASGNTDHLVEFEAIWGSSSARPKY